eukprot:TRINITY_DN7446_c0_g1_i1.p1 TRINITY_DN7446_c0_g1~~TRINITY_DN7446_c0_g1_i1.p1  ORF type:complete len:303 (+),score=62.31 TRINITY_DN7446_c0_g1_i1:28-909(+)
MSDGVTVPQGRKGSFLIEKDVTIGYELYGEGPEKVMMITGFGAKMSSWEKLVFELIKDPVYEVVIFDNRGSGVSTAPPDRYKSSQLGRDCILLMDHLKWNKAHVMGASMGGMIAQEMAYQAPERIASLLLSVTFRGSFLRSPFGPGLYGFIYKVVGLDKKQPKEWLDLILTKCFSEEYFKDETRKATIYKESLETFDRYMNISIDSLACHSAVASTHYMDDDRLIKISKAGFPITQHICTADKLIKPSDQFELQRLLKAKPIVFEGAGHLGSRERWDDWVAAVKQHLQSARNR